MDDEDDGLVRLVGAVAVCIEGTELVGAGKGVDRPAVDEFDAGFEEGGFPNAAMAVPELIPVAGGANEFEVEAGWGGTAAMPAAIPVGSVNPPPLP